MWNICHRRRRFPACRRYKAPWAASRGNCGALHLSLPWSSSCATKWKAPHWVIPVFERYIVKSHVRRPVEILYDPLGRNSLALVPDALSTRYAYSILWTSSPSGYTPYTFESTTASSRDLSKKFWLTIMKKRREPVWFQRSVHFLWYIGTYSCPKGKNER